MPSTSASSGSRVSSRRMSPRSLPYEVLFSETSMISLTPCSASQRVSPSTSLGRREMKEPRKDGMAQKEQRRSQPEASLTEATGLLSRRRRSGARGPEAGAMPSGRSAGAASPADGVGSPDVAWAWPGRATAVSWRAAGLIGSSLRRSRGVWEAWTPPLRMVWRRSEMSA